VAAFRNRGDERGDVIIGEDDIGGVLGDVDTGDAHGSANISNLNSGSVVDTVAGHGDDLATSVQRLNHLNFRIGRTAGNDLG
jgi:hypothetical protein